MRISFPVVTPSEVDGLGDQAGKLVAKCITTKIRLV